MIGYLQYGKLVLKRIMFLLCRKEFLVFMDFHTTLSTMRWISLKTYLIAENDFSAVVIVLW